MDPGFAKELAGAMPDETQSGDVGDKQDKKPKRRKSSHNKSLGKRGEDAAVRFLVRRGYDILERNWECMAGEADVIARDGSTVVFIEVKTRSNAEHGLPCEAVTKEKRARYEKIACLYLRDYEVSDVAVRFDVMGINLLSSDRAMIKHYINAFGTA